LEFHVPISDFEAVVSWLVSNSNGHFDFGTVAKIPYVRMDPLIVIPHTIHIRIRH
jgi:hypothetical protein